MKIGTFVMGGLAGAAIVMMIQRNQMMSAVAASMGQSVKSRLNDVKNELVGRALNMKFDGFSSKSASSSEKDEGGLSRVSQIASQDPEVTEQINAILEQNGQDRI